MGMAALFPTIGDDMADAEHMGDIHTTDCAAALPSHVRMNGFACYTLKA